MSGEVGFGESETLKFAIEEIDTEVWKSTEAAPNWA